MNKFLLISLFALFSYSFVQCQTYVEGELFVKIINESPQFDLRNQLPKSLRSTSIETITRPFDFNNIDLRQTYVVKFSNHQERDALTKKFSAMEEVEYVEGVPLHKFFYTPNDPLLNNQQWNIAAVDGELAWNITFGSSDIKIAVLDDAFLLNHEDLQNVIWQNPLEIPNNGLDEDGNGYIDDVTGWDAADSDNNVNPSNPSNFVFSHGTHCAGIAGAETDNSLGISSLGFGVSIVPVKIAEDAGGTISGAYDGLIYAMNTGVNVINMSWGSSVYSNTYQNLFDQAHAMNIVCVAAAGNNNSNTPIYPASYDHVIAVGASDDSDIKAGFSNFGSWIDVVAPGTNIIGPVATSISSYESYDGTSSAAALTAGLCGLMLSKDSSLTADEIESCLKSTTDDINPLNPGFSGLLGTGRINALKALQCVSIFADFFMPFSEICPGTPIQFVDQSAPGPILTWDWSFPGGTPPTSNVMSPTVSYSTPGVYDVTLIVSNADGTDTITKTQFVNVAFPTACMDTSIVITNGSSAQIPVYFTGNAPWDFTYSDGTNTNTINGITQSPYLLTVSPSDTSFYYVTSMNDKFCSGNVCSDSAWVYVLESKPTTRCNFANVFGDGQDNSFLDFAYDSLEDAYFVCGANNGNASFSKIQGDGTWVWTQEYSGITDVFTEMERAPNGDFVLYANENENHFLMRVDNTGTTIWAKRYSNAKDRNGHLIRSQGDSYFICGRHAFFGSIDDLHLIRVDANGNVVTSVTKSLSDDIEIHDVAPNGTGGAVCVGSYLDGGFETGFVANFDLSGGLISNQRIDYQGITFAGKRKIIRSNDGGYLTMGYQNDNWTYDIAVQKFDAQLQPLWDTIIDNSFFGDPNAGMNSLTQDNASNYYINYNAPNPSGGELTKVIKLSNNGGLIWIKEIQEFNTSEMKAFDGLFNESLGMASAKSPGDFGGEDGVFTVWDTSLTLCSSQNATELFTDRAFSSAVESFSSFSLPMFETNLNVSSSTVLYQDTTLCDSCLSICDISANFSSDTVVCINDTIQFTDLSIDTSFVINYWEWSFGNGDSAFTQNPSYHFGTSGSATVTLVVGNNGNPPCYDTITKFIHVTDSLVFSVMNNDTICRNDSIQLLVSTTCGLPPFTYSWWPNTSINDSTLAEPTVSPDSVTTYYVTITDSLGTIITDSVEIFVDQNCCFPIARFNVDTAFCINELITVIDSSHTNGNTSFQWDFGVDAVPASSTSQNPSQFSYTSGGVKNITLIINDSCGTDTVIQTIYINQLPNFHAGNDTSICLTDTIELGYANFGNYKYQWIPILGLDDPLAATPEAIVSNTITYTVLVTDPLTGCSLMDSVIIQKSNGPLVDLGPDTTVCGNSILLVPNSNGIIYNWNTGANSSSIIAGTSGNYSLTVTDAAGCTNSDDINVILASPPTINLGNDIFACGALSNTTLDAGTGYTYSWSNGSTDQTIQINQPGTYSVTITDGFGCTNNDDIAVNEIDNSLDIGGDIEECEGETVILNAGNGLSYLWQNGSTNQSISINSSGTYWVQVDFGQGCTNTDSINAVFKNSSLELEVSNDVKICNGNSALLTAFADGGEIEWPDGSSGSSFSVSTTGNYKVRAFNDCSGIEKSINVIVEECNCNFNIPNVFSPQNRDGLNDVFMIEFVGQNGCEVEYLTIFNRWGRKIFEQANTNIWDGKNENGNIVEHGVYYYVVRIGDEEYSGHVTRTQ
ncbi:MAG: S8 family serine peptidase [Flavobacteriales bacterium]|nr:S8 family serine peptidase [Flavobacteriales bacterium]